MKKRIFWLTVGVVALFFAYVAWPLRALVAVDLGRDGAVVLITNENEARPCGGFVTAFGVIDAWPPQISFQNIYALPEHNLGPAPVLIDRVSAQLKLWDAGTSYDLRTCELQYQKALETIYPGADYGSVILLDMGTLEVVTTQLDGVYIEGEFVSGNQIFAHLTRTAANVDRHNIEALNARKSIMKPLAMGLIKRTLARPWQWRSLSKMIADRIRNRDMYIRGISHWAEKEEDFALIEWNLGGGKSSRYLRKTLDVTLREVEMMTWQVSGSWSIEHLGGYDEPLSQTWEGVFEMDYPDWCDVQEEEVFAQELEPGGIAAAAFTCEYAGKELPELSFFAARGQGYEVDLRVMAHPQAQLQGDSWEIKESIGISAFTVKNNRIIRRIGVIPDNIAPFVTLHESVPAPEKHSEILAEWWIEIHINEAVTARQPGATVDGFAIPVLPGGNSQTWLLPVLPGRYNPARHDHAVFVYGLFDARGHEIESHFAHTVIYEVLKKE